MQKENWIFSFDLLKQQVISLLSDSQMNLKVSQKQQENELRSLSDTLGGQRFFFVVDLTNFEITEKVGIQKWLGYPESEFTYKQYWNLVHPGKQMPLLLVAIQLYSALCSGKYPLSFMVQRYSSLVALRHANGHYLLAKKTSSVFQYDDRNRLTSYLNEFTLIGEYNGEALSPEFYDSNGQTEVQKGGEVMEKVIERFLGMKVFSPQELQMARQLIYNSAPKQKEIAKSMNVSINTVGTYNKRFLTKSREFFHLDFATLQEAALHLKKTGLL